jgi:hypothetical protein
MVKLFSFKKLKSLDYNNLQKKKKSPNFESVLQYDIYLMLWIYF